MIKYIIYTIFFFLVVIFLLFYKDFKFINKGEKFDIKIYSSPQHRSALTLVLQTVGAGFNYHSFIYLIPGRYNNEKVPDGNNYIKFSDGTGVIINWKEEGLVEVLCDSEPIVDKFVANEYKVRIIIDRNHFDSLVKEGKKDAFIRYKIP